MATRNAITGDEIKTTVNSEAYKEGIGRIFGDTKVQRGRYKQDRETGKFIPVREWNAKYAEPERPRGPMVSVKNFDAFESPATGRLVRNERELREDMKVSGCRTYEGKDQEAKEANRYLQEQDRKMEKMVEESVEKTAYDIDHGYHQMTGDNDLTFTFGE